MKITNAEKSKRNKDRISVFIDDQYSFSICEDDYLRLNLYEDKDISEAEIEYIKNDIVLRNAKATAIRYMVLKLRSEKELGVKLENEGYDADTIEAVVEDLKSMGYVNDTIYAQKFVFDRSKLKPKGRKMLGYELEAKGISRDIIEEVLNNIELDDVSVAEGLIKKKFGKYDLNDENVINKIKAFLHHRGFSYSVIEDALNNYKQDR